MKYKSILLKLSGEVLAGEQGSTSTISPRRLQHYVDEIQAAHRAGLQIAVVIGGGNIWRGDQAETLGVGIVDADHMGMLATMINAIAIAASLEKRGIPTALMSRLPIHPICEHYSKQKARHHLKKGRVVIVGGGTSNPSFTTDSAASLTAIELGIDLLLKGTKVDFVYKKDPLKHVDAIPFKTLSLASAIEQKLGVMDLTALTLCQAHQLPIIVYNATKPNQLLKTLKTRETGTLIHP
ncbi:MAG: UMP kinase [Cytophagales bacterium]